MNPKVCVICKGRGELCADQQCWSCKGSGWDSPEDEQFYMPLEYFQHQLQEAKSIIEELWDSPKSFYPDGNELVARIMKVLDRVNHQGK